MLRTLSWQVDGIPVLKGCPDFFPSIPHVGDRSSSAMDQQRELLSQQLEETIQFFNGKGCKVWVMLAPPEFAYNVPLKLAAPVNEGKSIKASFMPRNAGLRRRAATDKLPSEVVSKHKSSEAAVLDPFDLFCSDGRCITVEDNRSLYYDKTHLSYYGSIYGSKVFQPVADELIRDSK